MLRFLVHYGIHFIVPIGIVFFFFKDQRFKLLLIFWGAMLIDIDHLWAAPIFDPNRCSIAFHPLHSYWAIGAYLLLFLFKKTRIIGAALLLHIFADVMDCWLLFQEMK